MRAAIFVAVSALLAFVVAPSCVVQHRSQDFACTTSDTCATGRSCINGYCVEGSNAIDAPGGSGTDAQQGGSDAGSGGSCPKPCTSCPTANTCLINCDLDAATCDSKITCPAGYSCTIKCNTAGACRAGIDCTNGSACDIECTGDPSCSGIECGSGACDVECTGGSSCRSGPDVGSVGVDCGSSCACVVNCTGTNSCNTGAVTCPQLCTSGSGCEDTSLDCNTCQP